MTVCVKLQPERTPGWYSQITQTKLFIDEIKISVIIAHNHPGGVAEPSDNDDKITGQIKNALQTVGISLQDHLVIAGNEYFSYRQTGYLE